ncbi:mismatch-specific DNA-glycosylase [Desulfitobacterium sp.]|uniref:mismatch-specific DNA-glycosylase n=1 Tax=Desulfitobacterium sp. TaxID=49981 RepID=UPI002BFF21B1|nr:mismatch-specific DNA-glycosylase [Desulfitobacterium sp.]HVJ49244.1 mismatch-specific DNA-glycosylase [Desulfitobacterium sp.]
MLPDVLDNDLKIVFCGTAIGNQSAANNAYYANPSNKFWAVLSQIALTPSKINPHDYNSLLEYGLGITDLVKTKHGVDNELSSSDFDRDGLTQRIIRFSPEVLCFNGKKAAQEYFRKKGIISQVWRHKLPMQAGSGFQVSRNLCSP